MENLARSICSKMEAVIRSNTGVIMDSLDIRLANQNLGLFQSIRGLNLKIKVKCIRQGSKLFRYKAVMTCSYGKCHNGGGSG